MPPVCPRFHRMARSCTTSRYRLIARTGVRLACVQGTWPRQRPAGARSSGFAIDRLTGSYPSRSYSRAAPSFSSATSSTSASRPLRPRPGLCRRDQRRPDAAPAPRREDADAELRGPARDAHRARRPVRTPERVERPDDAPVDDRHEVHVLVVVRLEHPGEAIAHGLGVRHPVRGGIERRVVAGVREVDLDDRLDVVDGRPADLERPGLAHEGWLSICARWSRPLKST